MTSEELKENLNEKLGIKKIHPLHDLMIDECCENTLKDVGHTDEVYFLSVQIGFVTANATLNGLLQSTLSLADKVTLNYRGKRFIIDKNSPILLPI